MKKIFVLFVAFHFLQNLSVVAQLSAADSLKRLLQTEKRDTSRVSLFNQLSKLYILNRQCIWIHRQFSKSVAIPFGSIKKGRISKG
jgi:hypothetical protein